MVIGYLLWFYFADLLLFWGVWVGGYSPTEENTLIPPMNVCEVVGGLSIRLSRVRYAYPTGTTLIPCPRYVLQHKLVLMG